MSSEEISLEGDYDWMDEVDNFRLEAVHTLREASRRAVNGEATNLEVKDLERLESRIHEIKRAIQEDRPFDQIEGDTRQ